MKLGAGFCEFRQPGRNTKPPPPQMRQISTLRSSTPGRISRLVGSAHRLNGNETMMRSSRWLSTRRSLSTGVSWAASAGALRLSMELAASHDECGRHLDVSRRPKIAGPRYDRSPECGSHCEWRQWLPRMTQFWTTVANRTSAFRATRSEHAGGYRRPDGAYLAYLRDPDGHKLVGVAR